MMPSGSFRVVVNCNWAKMLLMSMCKCFVRFPVATFIFFLVLHSAAIVATVVLFVRHYDVFPVDFQNVPVTLHSHPSNTRVLAWNKRNNNPNMSTRYVRDFYEKFPMWMRGQIGAAVFMYYGSSTGNVLTDEYLREMQRIENELFTLDSFQNDYCQWTHDHKCMKFISILRYFDGTFNETNPLLFDPEFKNVSGVLRVAYQESSLREQLLLALDLNADTDKMTASNCRSVVQYGWPLLPPLGTREHLVNYLEDSFSDELTALQKTTKMVTFSYFNEDLYYHDVTHQAFNDAKLCIGSLVFILVIVLLHTKSLWITFWAVYSIASSFAATNLIYRFIIGYVYFGFMHILSVFIILGIGVDDIFIFYDIWRQTRGQLPERLYDTYRHAVVAMFVTSFTTAAAFLVSYFSPLLLIQTFGLFSALLVVFNFISAVTFFPAVVLVYEVTFEKFCRKIKQRNNYTLNSCETGITYDQRKLSDNLGSSAVDGTYIETDIGVDNPAFAEETDYNNRSHEYSITDAPGVTTNKLSSVKNVQSKTKNNGAMTSPDFATKVVQYCHGGRADMLVHFFSGTYFRFVTGKYYRWLIMAVFTIMTLCFVYSCTRIRVDEEQLFVYRPDTNYGRSLRLHLYSFPQLDQSPNLTVYLVWGLKERNISMCNYMNITDVLQCSGTNQWDDEFNINDSGVQLGILNICRRFKNLSASDMDDLRIAINPKTGSAAVDCFMEDMLTFLKSQEAVLKSFRPDLEIKLNLPLNRSNLENMMKAFPMVYYYGVPTNYTNWFEIALSYWLTDAWKLLYTPDYGKYVSLIGESTIPESHEVIYRQYYGTRLRYFSLRVNLTLNSRTTPYTVGLPVLNRWEQFVEDMNKQMPKGGNRAFMCTPQYNAYQYLTVQKSLIEQAIYGVTIGIAIALPILLLSTRNWRLAFLAAITMLMSTTCVVGILPLLGWKLGVLVSMNLCLVVGLTVDYTIHFATAYHLSRPQRPPTVTTELTTFERKPPRTDENHTTESKPNSNTLLKSSSSTSTSAQEYDSLAKSCTALTESESVLTPPISRSDLRRMRTQDMLAQVSVPVLYGAITTLGAAVFMLFAQIQFYLNFGVFLLATILFSLIFGLIFFPALVSVFGPINTASK